MRVDLQHHPGSLVCTLREPEKLSPDELRELVLALNIGGFCRVSPQGWTSNIETADFDPLPSGPRHYILQMVLPGHAEKTVDYIRNCARAISGDNCTVNIIYLPGPFEGVIIAERNNPATNTDPWRA